MPQGRTGCIPRARGRYDEAYEERWPAMDYAFIGPRIDPRFEDDPRLQSIIRQIGVPSAGA